MRQSPTGSEPSSPTDEFSLRRISSFMLLTTTKLDAFPVHPYIANKSKHYTWYKYATTVEDTEFFVNISHRNRTFSAEDLMGFNNTGNVCIWPSEETLTYYIMSNLGLFADKTVIELGGGMSCLAGMFCAKYSCAKHVALTDGNRTSVDNVQISIYGNDLVCPVECRVLKWGQCDLNVGFDVVLCADCLFFDDARADLVKALWCLLNVEGVALIMAPKRGHTLNTFIAQCGEIGFKYKTIINYDRIVWEKHLALLDNSEYDQDIHYPILIELTKF